MNRTIAFALLLPLALAASPFRVDRDLPDRWEATWTLGAWHCDSSSDARSIHAPLHAPSLEPGSLVVPVAEATLALPPAGTWTIDVHRLDVVDVPGRKWARTAGWASNPIRTVAAPPTTPPAWRVDSTAHGRLLRLQLPWAEPSAGGLRLARRLKVVVHLQGTGTAPLAAPLRPLVANPNGAARFGIAPVAARRMARQQSMLPDGRQSILLTVRESEVGDRSRDGMVRITGTQLQSILGNLSGVDFDRVAVGAGPQGAIARTVSPEPAPLGLTTIPIRRFDRGNDGNFDPQDHIEFFVQGPSFWTPDSLLGDGLFQLSVHRWDMARRYLIRLDAEQGSPEIPVGKTPANPQGVSQVLRPVWAGRHIQLRVPEIGSPVPSTNSGASWFWHWAESTTLDSAALRHPAARDLPGLVGTQGTAVVRFALYTPGASDTFRAVGASASEGSSLENRRSWNLSGLKASDNRWTWRTETRSNDFESYTIHYPYAPRRTSFLPFPAPAAGSFSLPVPGATETDSVYAVVGGVAVRAIGLSGGVLRDSATTRDTWYHFAGTNPSVELSSWKAPTTERVLTPSTMASRPRVDLLVVAPDSFLDLAAQYAGFRADGRRHRVFTPGIVRTEDLWLLTGHGSQDPLAVRELLRTAVAEWGTTHVLLLGGGHYDPRGVTGATPGPIPVWQDEDVGTDAILTFLAPGSMSTHSNTQDVALGRIPARSRAEVGAWFQKLKVWEDPSSASPGPWRNTYLSAADDMEVRSGGGSPDGIYGENGELGHTHSAERVANAVLAARPGMTLRKVYEVEYPMNAALEKPDAQRALIDQLNRGVSAFMYLGHGGYDILADERLLDTRSALLGLTNASTPFLFYAGSCTVGRHEMVDARGLSEALLVHAGKGAVATISGTRPSYPENNEDLARAFWKNVLTAVSDGRAPTLGEAFQNAQNSFVAGSIDANRLYSNSSVYNLLGDPAMVPYPGGSPITLDNPPDTLAALDTYDFLGAASSQVQLSLNTRPSLQTATYTYGGRNYQQSYFAPGRTLVSVRTRADNGRYKAHLLTPARLPQGDSAIVHLYGWDPSSLKDGTVVDSQVVLFGIGDNPPDDRVGPRIRILPCDSSWTAGQPFGKTAEVPVPFCLNITFEDSSGISGSDAPDDGILLSVPGTLPAWHPTQIGEGADFTQAWTRLSLDAETFQPGKSYTLNVFARDLMGNASSASLELRTRAAGEIDLYEVFNRPNPAKGDATTFFFKLLADADSNGTVPQTVQASIRIHTLSGKLVRILQTDLTDVGHPRPRAVWDLKDAFRNEVANGLYPYTVLLRVRDPNTRNWRQTEKRGIVAVSR